MSMTRRPQARRGRRFAGKNKPVVYPFTITSTSPTSSTTSGSNLAVALTTVGVPPTAVAYVNGTAVSTTVVSSILTNITIPSSFLTLPTTLSIRLQDVTGNSNSVSFLISALAPTLTSVGPSRYDVGVAPGANQTFTLTGTNFYSSSAFTRVLLNGVNTAYTYVSSTSITMQVSDAVPQTLAFQVVNDPPGGGSSATQNAAINYGLPVVNSSSPTLVPINAGTITLTVNSTGGTFRAASVVTLDGVDLVTTFVNANQVTAVVPSSVTASPGVKVIRVRNPTTAGGGGVSATSTTLQVDAPTITSLSWSNRPQYFDAVTVNITGTNFSASDSVRWNGATALSMTFNSSTSLTAIVPATLLGTSGTFTIGVHTVGGYDTNTKNFDVISNDLTLVPELRCWLTGASLVDDGTGRAATWTDLSGLAHDASQPTSGQRPLIAPSVAALNNKPAAFISSSRTDFMDIGAWVVSGAVGLIQKTEYNIWIVGAASAMQGSSNPTLLGASAGSYIGVATLQTNALQAVDDTGGAATTQVSFTWAGGGGFAFRQRKTGGKLYAMAVRGTETNVTHGTPPSLFTPGNALIGQRTPSTGQYDGYIAEVMIVDQNSPYTILHVMSNYLAGKYGTSFGVVGTLATVSSVSPNTATQYDVPFTITVTGTGFTSGDVINCNEEPLVTTFVSSTSMTAALTSRSLFTFGTKGITVSTAGGISQPVALTVAAFNPGSGPNLTSISPNTKQQYKDAFTMTCTGSNFTPTAVVYVGATPMTTTFVSTTSLTATIPSSVLWTSGGQNVTVHDTAGNSTAQVLTVTARDPSNLTGAQAWYRGDSLVQSGGFCTGWTEKIAGTKNLSQGTGANQPGYLATFAGLNNQPVADFDGSNDSLVGAAAINTIISPSTWVLAVVYYADSITGTGAITTPFANNNIVGLSASGFFGLSLRNTPVAYGYTNDGAYKAAQNTGPAVTTKQHAVFTRASGQMDVYINNVIGTSITGVGASGFSSQFLSVGTSTGGYFDGKIAEVWLGNAAWVATDFELWKNYCEARYGII